MRFPDVLNEALVGKYRAQAKAGGEYVWDEVLEYRVWCHPERGAPDEAEGQDYYCAFASCDEALEFSEAPKEQRSYWLSCNKRSTSTSLIRASTSM
jgi:putative acetyltransferase